MNTRINTRIHAQQIKEMINKATEEEIKQLLEEYKKGEWTT